MFLRYSVIKHSLPQEQAALSQDIAELTESKHTHVSPKYPSSNYNDLPRKVCSRNNL